MKGSLTMPVFMAQGLLTAGEQGTLGTAGSNPLESFFTLLGSIAILVLILFLAFKCTQFIGRKYMGQNAIGGDIEIIGRTVIGPDRSLITVKLSDRVLLLGVTPHHISTLAELDASRYEGELSAGKATEESFGTLLKDTLGRGFDSVLGDKAAKKE